METPLKLFMVMLGCKPEGRFTEQHDVFFGIGNSIQDLLPQMNAFWPEAEGKLHIDAWREVTAVDDYSIEILSVSESIQKTETLFFINLGGYKPNEFEEYHYKILTVAGSLAEATKKSKTSAFYKHVGFKGAVSHIDDKYGIDVDDMYAIEDILSAALKEKHQLKITKQAHLKPDEMHIGYVTFSKLR